MSADQETSLENVQGEVRMQQTFTLEGAIGRAAGGAMKGASPVPRLDQAMTELIRFVNQHTHDPSGALKSILRRRIQAGEVIVGQHLEAPLQALQAIVQPVLENDVRLHEFVRQVDVRWGELFCERPHFQQPGQSPHPDDEYTHDSVRRDLVDLLERVSDAQSASG